MEKNTMLLNRKVLEKRKFVEISGDIIVPDSKPDVSSIIAANENSYIYKEEFLTSRYRFDGNSKINIIYLSSDGENVAIQTNLNFMEFVDDQSIDEKNFTKYKINVNNIEYRVLNERKINICIKLEINFKFYKLDEIEYFNNFDELSNVEKLQKNIEINAVVCKNKINTSFQDEFEIEAGKEVEAILKESIDVLNIENKISYNKVLSKAELFIKIMYLTKEMNIEIFETTAPITNFIDMENIADDNVCEIDYKIINFEMDVNRLEKNKINCKMDFEIMALAYKKQEIIVIQDMYGIDKNINFKTQKINVENQSDFQKEKLTIDENVLVEDVRQVFDVAYKMEMINQEISENIAIYSGGINVDIYYTAGNALCVKRTKVPFSFKTTNSVQNVEINFSRMRYKLNGEYVIFDIELDVIKKSENLDEINIVESIEESEITDIDDTSMVIYFVKPGDTIWKIAKNFRIPMENIINFNELEDTSKIYPGDKIYILK